MIGQARHKPDKGWITFDPRARILTLAVFVAAVCASSAPSILAAMLALSLLLLLPSGLAPGEFGKRILPVNAFMLPLWLTLPFFADGPSTPVFDLFTVSASGVRQALAITMKANAAAAATGALLGPAEPASLIVALHRLGAPIKLVWLLVLGLRYAAGMADKVGRSVTAIRMRSGKRGGLPRLAAYGGLFAKLLAGGHESGERLFLAMRSRGYGSVFALRRELRWRPRDSALAAAAAVLAVFTLWAGRLA